jgi:hypothetical protein
MSVDFRSSGGPGSLPGALAPAGSPAGVERLPLPNQHRVKINNEL